MPVILKNNASSTLATAITTSDTGIVVANGSQFPTITSGDYFYVTLVSQAGQTEIVKVTARVGNSMTVVRAQDGSSAASFQVGTLVDMRVNVASVLDSNGDYTTFDTVSLLLADTTLTYTTVSAGDVVQTRIEGFAYVVAASGATNHHVTTAGGVKLYVQADTEGGASVDAFGAVGDGTTDDRAIFIKAEASGLRPIRLSRSYFLSTNTGNAAAVYEIGANATVIMGTGNFQPSRRTDEKATTYSQKVNFTSTNPYSTGEPTVYTLMADSYIEHDYLINQWGRQNMDTQSGGATRTGAYTKYTRIIHTGEGDGYAHFWSAFLTKHPRTALATRYGGQNSGGLGGGQANAGSEKVNLYGFGDVVVHDQGYNDVALFNYVGISYKNGGDTGDYGVPRLGCFQLSNGTNAIDANFLAGGPTNIAFDATKAETTWGAYAMKSGQSILFDATEANTSTEGKFAATAPGNYSLSKPTGVNAFVFTRGADDQNTLRVAGSSATARATIGSAGTIAYFSAHTTGSDSTVLSLRTANAGTMGDRVIITGAGNVNVATAGARLQMASVNVLNARQTGWTAATGTATRTTFATSTVTTAQLAERVKGLIDDLITHGLIGA